jgi:hypothetical protein
MSPGARDRLARARLAIVEPVQRKEMRRDRVQPDGEQGQAAQAAAASSGGGWLTRLKRAAQSYWRHHPARMGLQLATPVLSEYAGRNPAAYIGIAAAAGAIVMVVRPWRLVSVTGVLVALAKSPQLAGVVMSAMSAMSGSSFDEQDLFS